LQNKPLKKVLTIVGSTASGKTTLAIEIAKRINGEIISLDSRQVFKGMAIGTAQPTKKQMETVKHHLIGCLEPEEFISSGKYAKLVKEKINDIVSQNKNPIICGGSGLYYRAIQKGIFEGSISNLKIRSKLEVQYAKNPEFLFNKLKSIDKKYSKIVHINNRQRLIRALEIYECTGKSPSEHFQSQYVDPAKAVRLYTIFLKWERTSLNKRIKERTKDMLRNGWIDEVENLLKLQTNQKKVFSSLNSIGYKHIKRFLKNKISEEEMFELIYVRTRQLARRQEKWFKKEPINLFVMMDSLKGEKIYKILDCFMNRIL
jgi:tRNA dimethylallyltransferase